MKSNRSGFCCLLLTVLVGSTILSGCEDAKDVFNPDHVQEEARKNFPVKDVDPLQTWKTSAVCNASVTINEKANEVYTIKVYAGNPYNTSANAQLLAKSTTTSGKVTNLKFDIPIALTHVYLMKVNSQGYSSAIPAAVENGTVKAAFGGENTNTRNDQTEINSASFFAPETPGEEMFPTAAPADCAEISTYDGAKKYLLKDATYPNINPWAGGVLYIQGNVTIKAWQEPSNITNFYVLPNSTLILEMEQFNHRPNSIFSVGSGAKVIASSTTLKGETGSKYFNRGQMETKGFEVTNAYVHNAGTINTTSVLLTNADSKFCNATNGTLTTSKITIQGNGHFLNETLGVVNVEKETTLNCNHGSWENAGRYTTNTLDISAWNKNVKNSCWLIVKDKFNVTDGGIFNENYIECNLLYMNNGTINMAPQSLLEVKEEAQFAYNADRGFFAPTTGEKAVLRMKRATRTSDNNNIAYSGNLFVACNDHFAQEQDQWNSWYKLLNGAELSGANNANIQIPASNCNPGYNAAPDAGGNDKLQTYSYAFEDMMMEVGDYDFNDVMLYASTPIDGKIQISLMAAGASKQLKVLFKYNGTVQTVFENVHQALGVAVGTITNTGKATGKVAVAEINVGPAFNLTEHGDIYISDGKRDVHIAEFTPSFKAGNIPYALRMACAAWKWPKEEIKITEAYPLFKEWAQDSTAEIEWYNQSLPDKVMN